MLWLQKQLARGILLMNCSPQHSSNEWNIAREGVHFCKAAGAALQKIYTFPMVFFKLSVLLIMPQMIKIYNMEACIFCKATGAALQKIYTSAGNFLSKLWKLWRTAIWNNIFRNNTFPVSTRRRFNVDSTSSDVESTLKRRRVLTGYCKRCVFLFQQPQRVTQTPESNHLCKVSKITWNNYGLEFDLMLFYCL